MKPRKSWKPLAATLERFDLPRRLEKALRWVEGHPRAVVAGTLILVTAVMLAQTPTVEPDAYNGETPLFV
ncbi:MAG: hypothetical protein ACE5HL_00865 [Terriglobia bacterium]